MSPLLRLLRKRRDWTLGREKGVRADRGGADALVQPRERPTELRQGKLGLRFTLPLRKGIKNAKGHWKQFSVLARSPYLSAGS